VGSNGARFLARARERYHLLFLLGDRVEAPLPWGSTAAHVVGERLKTVAEPGSWECPLPTVTPEEKPAAAPRRAAFLSSYLKAFSAELSATRPGSKSRDPS